MKNVIQFPQKKDHLAEGFFIQAATTGFNNVRLMLSNDMISIDEVLYSYSLISYADLEEQHKGQDTLVTQPWSIAMFLTTIRTSEQEQLALKVCRVMAEVTRATAHRKNHTICLNETHYIYYYENEGGTTSMVSVNLPTLSKGEKPNEKRT